MITLAGGSVLLRNPAKMQQVSREPPFEELIFGRKSPGWGWLLMAVIAIDSLLAAGVWFAVGYIVQ